MPPPPPIFPIFVHPQVWDTSIPVIAAHHPPVLVKLKDPTVTLEVCSSLNPATLLPDPLKPPHTKHSCPEVLEAQPPSHLHVHDRPLQNAQLTLFVDGSSFINPQGNRQAGYAVVTSSTVLEAKPLPQGTTSQQAELTALTKALLLSKGKTVNIYTDSKYAFLIAHTHSVIWKERVFNYLRYPYY